MTMLTVIVIMIIRTLLASIIINGGHAEIVLQTAMQDTTYQ